MIPINNIEQLPMELLNGVFSHVDDQKSIQKSRLVSHRFKDASTPYLIQETTVCMRSKSLASLEELSTHPIYGKSISSVTIVLSFFDVNMAADRGLYMRNCQSGMYFRVETFDRFDRLGQTIRRQLKGLSAEAIAAETEKRKEISEKLWNVIASDQIRNTAADDFDEASASIFQKLVLRLHTRYKERCNDQEQVRQGNEHIKRICTALSKLPNLTKIKLKDSPQLVSKQLKESDFMDLGLERSYLRLFDWVTSPSKFCGIHICGSAHTAYLVHTPLEMVGELASQLGGNGLRPKIITMHLNAPANLRPMALTPSQQAGVRGLVSKATDLRFVVDGWEREGNNDRSRDEMLALCSLTQPYFTVPYLESLQIQFSKYPLPTRQTEAPTVSLSDILPLQKPWLQLHSMKINYMPAHLEELKALIAIQKDTVRSFIWDYSWLLSGHWDQAVESLRGFNKLDDFSLEHHRGG